MSVDPLAGCHGATIRSLGYQVLAALDALAPRYPHAVPFTALAGRTGYETDVLRSLLLRLERRGVLALSENGDWVRGSGSLDGFLSDSP